MPINRKFLFNEIREKLFPSGLQQHQVDGIDAILNEWESKSAAKDDRWLAYMLATAYHESARTMQPVRETLANTNDQAIARLDNAWNKGKLSWVSKPYWRKDANGDAWFGRGLVQITHKANYTKLATATGHKGLATDPDEALKMDVALDIMFAGMEQGLFAGKKLSDYFNGAVEDWVNARRIINGLDRADDVASYGRSFYAAISYTT
ncbi:MAG: putative chitinase [Rhizobium sp.]|nr:putative chitinase [Rhizobium sp.]